MLKCSLPSQGAVLAIGLTSGLGMKSSLRFLSCLRAGKASQSRWSPQEPLHHIPVFFFFRIDVDDSFANRCFSFDVFPQVHRELSCHLILQSWKNIWPCISKSALEKRTPKESTLEGAIFPYFACTYNTTVTLQMKSVYN